MWGRDGGSHATEVPSRLPTSRISLLDLSVKSGTGRHSVEGRHSADLPLSGALSWGSETATEAASSSQKNHRMQEAASAEYSG